MMDMFGLPLPLAALLVALLAAAGGMMLTRRAFADCGRPVRRWDRAAALFAGLLGGVLVFAMLEWQCQQTPDVIPAAFWWQGRIVYHAILLVLLAAATATDLDCCLIPDSITVPGMFIGLIGATIAGDLQVAHVWVDWNQEIPQFSGPYRPEWLSAHPHLHGLAWSAAGLIAGAGLTWTVRWVSSAILRMEALGFGDVMLMGMIGSFLGWQPTVIAFLIAPLCALTVGLAAKYVAHRPYVPYGPYLALGALVVMFSWRWIWMLEIPLHPGATAADREGMFALRRLFGDWLSLLLVAVATILALALLLGLRQIYRAIPVSRRTVGRTGSEGSDGPVVEAADESEGGSDEGPEREDGG